MTVAETLATFLIETGYDDLPHQAVEHAAMIVASTIASAACGTNIESAAIVRDLVKDRGGKPDASIWFDGGRKLPLVSAARVNAMMSDAAASDDSDLRNIVHAGTPLTATALAVAERTGANGKDILAAIVLGYEAAGRIGEAIMPRFNYRGHHGCMGAVFGGAVAAARLLGLDAAQTAHTIALTATSIGGLSVAANTSVAREYHAGLATMLGLEAALSAQRGYTAELSILEAERGFCALYARHRRRQHHERSGRVLGHRDRNGNQARAGRPSLPRAGRGRGERRAERKHRAIGRRVDHRLPTRHDRARRAIAPDRPYRYGAQPPPISLPQASPIRISPGFTPRRKRSATRSFKASLTKFKSGRNPPTMSRITGKARP